jgi:hypothetical protein
MFLNSVGVSGICTVCKVDSWVGTMAWEPHPRPAPDLTAISKQQLSHN